MQIRSAQCVLLIGGGQCGEGVVPFATLIAGTSAQQ